MLFRGLLHNVRKFVHVTCKRGLRETIKSTIRYILPLAGGLSLQHQITDLQEKNTTLQEQAEQLYASIHALTLHRIGSLTASSNGDTLVSVIMPAWNARESLTEAVRSVLVQSHDNWELLVVDDGSTDGTREGIEPFLEDERIRLLDQPHAGVCAARNRALGAARGEVIAYLDSDNVWCAHYLSTIVAELSAHPESDSIYCSQLVENLESGSYYLRFDAFDRERLHEQNYIDLNVFAHRRAAYEQYGGFDENLTRLVDWDLIARYCKVKAPLSVPVVGGIYREGKTKSITQRESHWLNYYRVRRKLEQAVSNPPRVLYVLWHFPQITESYIRFEIAWMRRRGVEIEVWSESSKLVAPFEPDVPVHYGSLQEAIGRFQPQVVHVHWLHMAQRFRDPVARFGLQITARSHGFDFSPEVVKQLHDDPAVSAIYLFPHFARKVESGFKVRSVRSAFHGDLYYPEKKDPRLVVRTGAALQNKDLEIFFQAAKQCPNHRFVLVLGCALDAESYVEKYIEYNQSLGSPVDLRVNVDAEEVAALVREAGIYLHGYSFGEPFGMPVGICEAMATGAYVIARRCEGIDTYLGDVGALYDTLDEAVERIEETLTWGEQVWRRVRRETTEHAYEHHADIWTLQPILDDWMQIAQSHVMFNSDTQPLDERFGPLLDYLFDQKFDRYRHHDSALTSHMIGIGRGLWSWHRDLDVCQAGMVHSIYGTEKGGTGYDLSRRKELRQVIGERAERLVYYNCAMKRGTFDEAVARGRAPYRFRNRFTNQEIELSEPDFNDLCCIHLCDWLEQVPRAGKWNERRDSYERMARRIGGETLQSFEYVYGLAGSGS